MREIKISELSIGDWVKCNGFKATIAGYSAESGSIHLLTKQKNKMWFGVESIEPILLTPEILEKNGFIDYEVGKGWYVLNVAGDLRVWLHRNSHDWTFQLMKWSPLSTHEIGKVFIKHTHQLQHALRLAGVEKEIEV